MAEKKRLNEPVDAIMARLTTTSEYGDGFREADIVIEAVFEEIGVKKQVYGELCKVVRDDCIVASNTSSIPITSMAPFVAKPERFGGIHFFSPVWLMQLVEVIRGEKTAQETIDNLLNFAALIKKRPIVCRDNAGFVVNAMLFPEMIEALRYIEEGNSIEKVDRAMTRFGMPVGPIRLTDEVGIDIPYKVFVGMGIIQETVKNVVEAGRLGLKKSGKGFFLKDGSVDPEVLPLIAKRPPHERQRRGDPDGAPHGDGPGREGHPRPEDRRRRPDDRRRDHLGARLPGRQGRTDEMGRPDRPEQETLREELLSGIAVPRNIVNKDTSPHTFPPHLIWLLVGLTLGWGINWPIMKAVLSEMAPMHFRTLCLFFGAVGLFTIARVSGLPIRIPQGQWPRMVAIALVNTMAWNIFAVYGVRFMASGRAAILGYTMPVWSVIIATWLLKEPFTKRRALGCALGGAGLLLLLGEEIQAVGRSPLGAMLMICAAVSWAIGTIMMKRWPVSLNVSAFTAWQMLISAPPIILFAITFETGPFNPFALSLWPMLGVFYNVFVAFIFSYWAWTKIALTAPVGVSSLSIMMTPVVGVFSGMLLLGETPHWQDYAALVLVVTSLATVLLPARPIAPRSEK